jgi:excinuclease ABC subunit C
MKGLFARQAFTGFGPAALDRGQEVPPLHTIRGRRPARLRALVRQDCPRLPGVYGMVDATGELIYVGKAKSLRARLLTYFRPKSREPKAGRILEATRLLVWEVAPSEFGALLRELELIRRWRPRFNVQGQPARQRRTYVCVGRQPAPHVFLANRPPSTASARFGPVQAGRKAREAVRRVNDCFRLRDCPQSQEMVFADQQELFPILRAAGCLRHEINTCLGPCIAACSHDEYAAAERAVLDFLSGRDDSMLKGIETDMTAAAAALAFERAAALRDKHDELRWLAEQLGHVREAARRSGIYPVPGHDGTELWYLIHGGRVRAVLPAPPEEARSSEAARLLASLDTEPAGLPRLDEVDGVLLVAAWFHRHSGETARLLTLAGASSAGE